MQIFYRTFFLIRNLRITKKYNTRAIFFLLQTEYGDFMWKLSKPLNHYYTLSIIIYSIVIQWDFPLSYVKVFCFLQNVGSGCKMNLWNFLLSTSSDVDKGWAWVVLLTTFLTYGFGWGFISSIEIFYSIWIDEFNASKATIAWITSLPVFFLYLSTPIVVSLRKYTKSYQVLGFVGITLCSSSLVLSTYINNHYWLFLTYSLLMGIGFSLSQTHPLLLLNKYFIKHLSLANGVTLTGTSVFALVLPILYAMSIEGDGWRMNFRITGVISFVICGSCTLLWRAQHHFHLKIKTTMKQQGKNQKIIITLDQLPNRI